MVAGDGGLEFLFPGQQGGGKHAARHLLWTVFAGAALAIELPVELTLYGSLGERRLAYIESLREQGEGKQ